MRIHNFIGGSSALLLAWLGATYLHEVPSERYPKLGPSHSSESAVLSSPDAPLAAHHAERDQP